MKLLMDLFTLIAILVGAVITVLVAEWLYKRNPRIYFIGMPIVLLALLIAMGVLQYYS